MKKLVCILLSTLLILSLLLTSCKSSDNKDKAASAPKTTARTQSKSVKYKTLSDKEIEELKKKFDKKLYTYDFEGECYITVKGKVLYNKSTGYADRDKKIKDDENTVFRIASISKQFTAAAVMLLQERGKLSVNDKLSKYFPDYKYGEKITIDNLLNMRSGIPEYMSEDYNNSILVKYDLVNNSAEENRKIIEKDFMSVKLRFSPGEKYEYSNSNYMLLGEIIEKASGTTYEKFLKKEIFDKLGMDSTGFIDSYNKKSKTVAKPYNLKDEDKLDYKIKGVSFGCGSIMSSAVDLDKWINGLVHNKIISGKSFKSMVEAAGNNGYGYGVNIIRKDKAAYHSGLFPPYYSMIFYAIEGSDCNFILLSNNNCKNTAEAAMRISKEYLDAVLV